MSNKTLGIVIVVIIVLFAGMVVAVKSRNMSSSNNQAASDQYNPGQQADSKDVAPTTTPEQLTESSTTPKTIMQDCKRDFDDNKLKTEKVDIKNRQVTLDVKDFGKITVVLYDKDAPKAAENFLRLTNSGYYDCLTFHRIAKGFVIQAGDPNGNGTGGQSAFGAPFADELDPNTPSAKAGYKKGVLAMANSGPNTNGSQFFIMLADVSLPHNYTIFGTVVTGMDTVDKIGQVDIHPEMGPTDGSPLKPIVIQSAKITK